MLLIKIVVTVNNSKFYFIFFFSLIKIHGGAGLSVN